jgi:hypothetical protein
MTRRDANWLILRATAIAPWLNAHQEHLHSSAPSDPHNWTNYRPKFFSPEDFQLLASFTEILIPTDDTPGAREAHVAAFIDFVVDAAAEFAPETQDHWRAAALWLHSIDLKNITAPDQLSPHFQLIKEMTVHAFYTSRIGLIDVLEYQGNAYLTEFPGCAHQEHHDPI